MQCLGAIVLAAVLSGCACAGIGCRNALAFVLPHDLEPGVQYDVELCVDDFCQAATLMVPDRDGLVFGGQGRLVIDTGLDAIQLQPLNGDYGGSHDIGLVVREEGRQIVAYSGSHEFVSSGGWPCGETCWDLTVDVPAGGDS